MSNYPAAPPEDPNEMWEIHKGLAVKLTDGFHKRYPDALTFDEKLAHACIGMLKAKKKWKPDGARFSTMAHQAIIWELDRAVQKERIQMSPGPLDTPGKYNVKFRGTDYQEPPATDYSSSSVHHLLYSAGQVTYQHPDKSLDFETKTEFIRKKLKPKYRKAFKLMVTRGLSYGEAAVAVGVSREAMRRVWNAVVKEMTEYHEQTKAPEDL